MKSNSKTEAVESVLQGMFGFDRRTCIQNMICVPKPIGCGNPLDGYMSEIEQAEYRISGLCANCQREIFKSNYSAD